MDVPNSDDLRQALVELHVDVIKRVGEAINSDKATAADRTLAWNILKDNGVMLFDLGFDKDDDSEGLVDRLPFNREEAVG